MKAAQWYIFSVGSFLLAAILNCISVRKNNLAVSMIGTDMVASAAWKIIGDMAFLFSTIFIGLSLIFLLCGVWYVKVKKQ